MFDKKPFKILILIIVLNLFNPNYSYARSWLYSNPISYLQQLTNSHENRYIMYPFFFVIVGIGICFYKYRQHFVKTKDSSKENTKNDQKEKISLEEIRTVGESIGFKPIVETKDSRKENTRDSQKEEIFLEKIRTIGESIGFKPMEDMSGLHLTNIRNIALFLQTEDNGWPTLEGTDEYKKKVKRALFKEYIGFVIGTIEREESINEMIHAVKRLNVIDSHTHTIHVWKQDLIYLAIFNKYTRKCERSFSEFLSLRNYQAKEFHLNLVNERTFKFEQVDKNDFFSQKNRYNIRMFLKDEGIPWSPYRINHSLYDKIILKVQEIKDELFKKYIKPILDIELQDAGKRKTLCEKVDLVINAIVEENKSYHNPLKEKYKNIINNYYTQSINQIADLLELRQFTSEKPPHNIAIFRKAEESKSFPWRLLVQIDQNTEETKRQLFKRYVYPCTPDPSEKDSFTALMKKYG